MLQTVPFPAEGCVWVCVWRVPTISAAGVLCGELWGVGAAREAAEPRVLREPEGGPVRDAPGSHCKARVRCGGDGGPPRGKVPPSRGVEGCALLRGVCVCVCVAAVAAWTSAVRTGMRMRRESLGVCVWGGSRLWVGHPLGPS